MISIKSAVFNFSSENHINILGSTDGLSFESGTHKSHLFTTLRSNYINGLVESDKNMIFITDITEVRRLKLDQNDCVIIDEVNYAPSSLEYLLQCVRDSNAYVIVIGRMYVKQLQCSVDAIYALKYENGCFSVDTVFKNVKSTNLHADDIECEDNVSVASLYAELLDVDNVSPVCGRGNFFRFASKYKCPLLIADKPKFGQNLLTLIYLLKNKYKEVKTKYLLLFLPDSFEEIICEASKDTELQFLYSREDYFDGEDYYEALAATIDGWNKKHVSKSLKYLREVLDFENTNIMQDLYKFYNNDTVTKASRCYVLDIDKIKINDYVIENSDYKVHTAKDYATESHLF